MVEERRVCGVKCTRVTQNKDYHAAVGSRMTVNDDV